MFASFSALQSSFGWQCGEARVGHLSIELRHVQLNMGGTDDEIYGYLVSKVPPRS